MCGWGLVLGWLTCDGCTALGAAKILVRVGGDRFLFLGSKSPDIESTYKIPGRCDKWGDQVTLVGMYCMILVHTASRSASSPGPID